MSKDNGNKTFVRITNQMIYQEIQGIHLKLNDVMTKEDCKNHRTGCLNQKNSNRSWVISLISAIIAFCAMGIAFFKKG